jgi:hypothetical protein
MIGGFFATNIGSTMPFGMDGWRFAFHLMALVSLITSALVFYIATDPRPTAKVCRPASKMHTMRVMILRTGLFQVQAGMVLI